VIFKCERNYLKKYPALCLSEKEPKGPEEKCLLMATSIFFLTLCLFTVCTGTFSKVVGGSRLVARRRALTSALP
jgi:hypothetical protein